MKEEKIELAGLRFSSNRVYGGEGDLQILAEDIKQNGLINPITVKAIPGEEIENYALGARMQQDLPFEAEEGSGEESSLFDDEEGNSELHIVEHGEDSE